MATDTVNLDLLSIGHLTFDGWVRAHDDATRDRERARNILAGLSWPEWGAWQAWAICGLPVPAGQEATVTEARRTILSSVRGHGQTPRADATVPILREADIINQLDEDELRAWLSIYVNGRAPEYLAERHNWTPKTVARLLRQARAGIQLLLPPDLIGPACANGQVRLTF